MKPKMKLSSSDNVPYKVGVEPMNNKLGRFVQEDITNQTYNFLTPIKYLGRSIWLCKCTCGKEKPIRKFELIRGITKSCGCQRPNLVSQVRSKGKTYNKRLSKIYNSMKERCLNPKTKQFIHYGARGIKVCDEWINNYDNFYWWAMKNGYKDNLTIDRMDVNGNYEPSNCRWATNEIQANNKRNTIRVEIDGEFLTITEIAKKYSLSKKAIYYRYYRGYEGKELVSKSGELKHNSKGELKSLC
jgi:hypothetical protein